MFLHVSPFTIIQGLVLLRSSRPDVFCKKDVLKNFSKFTGKHLCQSLFFNKVAGLRPATLLKKKTLAQVFPCEYYKISKNTFSYRTPLVAASVYSILVWLPFKNKELQFYILYFNNLKLTCKIFLKLNKLVKQGKKNNQVRDKIYHSHWSKILII